MNLRPLLLASPLLLALLAGCASRGGPEPFNPGGDLQAAAQKYIEPDRVKPLKGMQQVIIPGFHVEFIVRSSAGASSFQSTPDAYFSSVSASSSRAYNLVGISDAQMQALSDRLYQDLIRDLTAAGIRVIPVAAMQGQPAFQKLREMMKPNGFTEDRRENKNERSKSKFFAPSGLGPYFGPEFDGKRLSLMVGLGNVFANFGTSPTLAEEELAKAMGATVLRVRYLVDFADQSVSTDRRSSMFGLSSASTEQRVRFALAVVPQASAMLAVSPDGYGFSNKGKPSLAVKLPVVSAADDWALGSAEVNATSNRLKDAAATLFTMALGNVSNISTKEFDVQANPQAWEKAVSESLFGTQEMFIIRLRQSL